MAKIPIENLVVFTYYKDSPPVDELIIKLPYSGVITEIQITSPSAVYPVAMELQERIAHNTPWTVLPGSSLSVGPTQVYQRKEVHINTSEGSYLRLRSSVPQLDFSLVFQFIITVMV